MSDARSAPIHPNPLGDAPTDRLFAPTFDALEGGVPSQPSPPPTRVSAGTARRILGGGAVAGAVGALLFTQEVGGIGLAAYLIALTAGLAGVARVSIRTLPPRVTTLLGAGAAFALLLVGRSAEILTFANTVAALFFITVASAFAKPGATRALTSARVRDLLALVPTGVIEALSGTPRFLFGDARAAFESRDGTSASRQAVAITRAGAIGALLIVLFGVLLAGGDPVFRSMIAWPRWLNEPEIPAYLARFVFLACPAIALMWSTTRASSAPDDVLANGITLNRLDVLVALVSLNGLFGVYLLLQLRVLFGGSAYVLSTTGLTLAEYARSGFFALTVAAGLVLTVLLALNALMRTERLGGWMVSRRLSTSLLVMVGLMLASAAARMLLYVQSYGITIDRIIALAIMAWLGLTGVWFTLTVLRERTTRFVIGAVVAGSLTLVALNLINPAAIVVQSAVARAALGDPFDTPYVLREAGSDGVPALVEAVTGGALAGATVPAPVMPAGTLPGPSRPAKATDVPTNSAETDTTAPCAVARALLERWSGEGATPLGSWTVSAARAAWVVSRNADALQAQCRR